MSVLPITTSPKKFHPDGNFFGLYLYALVPIQENFT